jgi:hypothetical protein
MIDITTYDNCRNLCDPLPDQILTVQFLWFISYCLNLKGKQGFHAAVMLLQYKKMLHIFFMVCYHMPKVVPPLHKFVRHVVTTACGNGTIYDTNFIRYEIKPTGPQNGGLIYDTNFIRYDKKISQLVHKLKGGKLRCRRATRQASFFCFRKRTELKCRNE